MMDGDWLDDRVFVCTACYTLWARLGKMLPIKHFIGIKYLRVYFNLFQKAFSNLLE